MGEAGVEGCREGSGLYWWSVGKRWSNGELWSNYQRGPREPWVKTSNLHIVAGKKCLEEIKLHVLKFQDFQIPDETQAFIIRNCKMSCSIVPFKPLVIQGQSADSLLFQQYVSSFQIFGFWIQYKHEQRCFLTSRTNAAKINTRSTRTTSEKQFVGWTVGGNLWVSVCWKCKHSLDFGETWVAFNPSPRQA